MLIEIGHSHGAGSGNDRREPRQAQASLKEHFCHVRLPDDFRIDEHLKGDRLTFSGDQLVGGHVLVVVGAILDDQQLHGISNLRCGQADAGRSPHGLAHLLDESADFRTAELADRQGSGELAEYGITNLGDKQRHRIER